MNKNRYRIVFSKVRGLLIVVADIAGAGKGASSGGGAAPAWLTGKTGTLSFCLWLALGVVQSAGAALVADRQAPGNQQPTVINSANGTPQVNIQAPSAGGVSRNTYREFDVTSQGVVLNNARQNIKTQLAGMVSANPWLAKGEAKIILNEINSRHPSQLNGFIEVAGKPAQVVIANPSGITCNGCGFINADRATLTTGRAEMNKGRLSGFRVEGGDILVEGAGLDSGTASYTDIIARSVKVNAALRARDLNITTGRNRVDAHSQQTEKLEDTSQGRPEMALDVASLGGMYATKIRLTGTEQGVGVRNAGHIGVPAGDVMITVDGNIMNAGTIDAGKALSLTARGKLDNQGRLYAGTETQLRLRDGMSNNGLTGAANHITLDVASLESCGIIVAGLTRAGETGQTGNISAVSRGRLSVQGKMLAGGDIALSGREIDLSTSQTAARQLTLDASHGHITTRDAQMDITGELTATTRGTLNNDNGSLTAEKLTLQADHLSNQRGRLLQTGTTALTLNHASGINNQDGTIATRASELTLRAESVSNQRGTITHAGEGQLNIDVGSLAGRAGRLFSTGSLYLKSPQLSLNEATIRAQKITLEAGTLSHRQGEMVQHGQETMTLTVSQKLDNQGGKLLANADIAIDAGELDNRSGKIVAAQRGALVISVQGEADNRQGVMAAGRHLALDSTGLNNDVGRIQSGTDMSLNTHGQMLSNRNSAGQNGIISPGRLTLNSGQLDNHSGVLMAEKAFSLTSSTLSNREGVLASSQHLTLHTGAVDNTRGTLQAGATLMMETQGQSLTNTEGTVSAGDRLALTSGEISNQHGLVSALTSLQLRTDGQRVDNQAGSLITSGNATLDTGVMDNRGGQVQATGSLIIRATGALIDNTLGLLRTDGWAELSALNIINRQQEGSHTGMESRDLTVIANTLDNRQGSIATRGSLSLNISHQLDNSRGQLSGAGNLRVQGSEHLTVINRDGRLVAGDNVTLQAGSLSGDGKILAGRALNLGLQQGFINTRELISNGTLSLAAPEVDNQGLIKAGTGLMLNATTLNNQRTGEISADSTRLRLSGTLINRGVMDGRLTHLVAAEIHNTGSGKIYGDHIAIQSERLSNQAENGTSATIAARERLDTRVGVVTNSGHSLLYSLASLTMGGRLSADGTAVGRGGALLNAGATIESAGRMLIDMARVDNLNPNLVTETVVTEQSQHHEAVLAEQITRYDWSLVDTRQKNKYGVHTARMPDGSQGETFYEYQYQRTVQETRVKQSDPGQIIAGGDLTINSAALFNSDSRIMAGGLLSGTIDNLRHQATQGVRIITDVGRQIRWYAKKKKRPLGGTKTSQGKESDRYQPAPVRQSVDLNTYAWQSHTAQPGAGTGIINRDTSSTALMLTPVNTITFHPDQPVLLPPQQTWEIPAQDGDVTGYLIRTAGVNTRLPENSLYHVIPQPTERYLTETDPRFTDTRQWLSSDYMMNAVTHEPGAVMKRLGDGFYEQQLIRQQVAQLTGQRYLAGYQDDEEQYRALMNNGIAFGAKYHLKTGVALTPAQMQLLTGDIVWLVSRTVTLADGRSQQVLVPQLYARVNTGDVEGNGSLLGGEDMALSLTGDVNNSGTLRGRNTLHLSLENLINQGLIRGNKVDIRARTDIDNTGGVLSAGESLLLGAERDIHMTSTLHENKNGRRIDRMAGLYVMNDKGQMILHALNNINLNAALVSHNGVDSNTRILAGKDLKLGTVTTTQRENAEWGSGTYRRLNQSQQTGSRIDVKGALTLSAGRDLSARGAEVRAENALRMTAGHDLSVTEAESGYHLKEHSKQVSRGAVSAFSLETDNEVSAREARGSLLSGEKVSLVAGHDMQIRGSTVVGEQNVILQTGNDLRADQTTAQRTVSRLYDERKSGLMSSGGIGFSIGRKRLTQTDETAQITQHGSTLAVFRAV